MRILAFLKNLFSTMLKMMLGRWFVFRDMPLEFLVDVTEAHREAKANLAEYEKTDPFLIKYWKEADAELERRREQAHRQGREKEFQEQIMDLRDE